MALQSAGGAGADARAILTEPLSSGVLTSLSAHQTSASGVPLDIYLTASICHANSGEADRYHHLISGYLALFEPLLWQGLFEVSDVDFIRVTLSGNLDPQIDIFTKYLTLRGDTPLKRYVSSLQFSS